MNHPPDIPPALLTPVEQICLYDEPDALGLDIHALGAYLVSVLPSAEAHLRRDFLTHPVASQLAVVPHDVLRSAARAILVRPGHQPGRLKLRDWLAQVKTLQNDRNRRTREATRDRPRTRRSYEVNAPPADTELHRRIGSTQRYDEDT